MSFCYQPISSPSTRRILVVFRPSVSSHPGGFVALLVVIKMCLAWLLFDLLALGNIESLQVILVFLKGSNK